jgi:hypothetical protein
MNVSRLMVLGLLLTGCGPTPLEVGSTALLGAVVYLMTSSVLVHFFAMAWRRVRRQPERFPEPALQGGDGVSFALHLAVSLLSLVFGSQIDDAPQVVAIIAGSHLTFSLLLWRLLQLRAVTIATIASLPCLIPAVAMVTTRSVDIMELGSLMWIATSYLCTVPAIIGTLLLVEALVRRVRSPEPPDESLADAFD